MPKKNNDELINEYSRNFIIEIYNEWDNYNEIINYIKSHYKKYLYIVHDKDIWVESDYKLKKEYMDKNNIKVGDVKKIHTHIVVLFTNPRYRNTIANELNINLKWVQKCKKNYITNLQYLIHENDIDKYHYNTWECLGNNELLLELKRSINHKQLQERNIIDIIDLIGTYTGVINITEFTIEICKRGLYGTYRNSWSIIKEIIIEHNQGVFIKENEIKL